MAEVLSQSQIDALLQGLAAGNAGPDNQSSPEEKEQQKYRKYDFSSPRKFTKDRIKLLNGVFENYARVVNTRLNSRLRTSCEVTVESVEEQHYYEFANALGEGDVLVMSDVDIKDKRQDIPVMLYLSTWTALTMIDRLMGGEGSDEKDIPSNYTYTQLELRLYEELVEDMVTVMGGSWENYVPIKFSYDKIDVNPTMSQLIGLDEIVVIVDMRIDFDNGSGRICVCLPADILSNVFTEISKENPTRRAATEKKTDEIFDSLRDSNLEVIARLGSTELSLSDIYHLNVGDVIDIGTPKDGSIYLEIGGYRWFAGKMGTHNKNVAVKISSVC